MALPTSLSYLGIAKETTRGTGVAPSAFIPLKTIDPYDKVEYYPVEVLQGSMAQIYGEVQGYKWTEFEVAGPVFADTYAWIPAGILGDMTAATGSRSVADGVTTINTPNVTSATAAWTQADVGRSLTTPNLPAGTWIISVQSATAATVSQNATASGAAQSFTIGNAAVFQNSFALFNTAPAQPTSHTLTDFYGVTGTNSRQYSGFQWTESTLKFSTDGLLEHTSKGTGLNSSVLVAKPTQSFTAVLPIPSWGGAVTIGGTVVSKAVEAEITLSRKFEVIKSFDASQSPTIIFLGAFAAKGKITFYIDDDTELVRYLTNTQPSLTLAFSTGGAAATLTSIGFQATKAAYTNAKIIRSKEYVQCETEFEAVANTTDVGASGGYSPCIVRCQSVVNGGYV